MYEREELYNYNNNNGYRQKQKPESEFMKSLKQRAKETLIKLEEVDQPIGEKYESRFYCGKSSDWDR